MVLGLVVMAILSCSKQDDWPSGDPSGHMDQMKSGSPEMDSLSVSELFGEFKFTFKAWNEGNKLNSYLSVDEQGVFLFDITDMMDISVPAYRLVVYKDVVHKATQLVANYSNTIFQDDLIKEFALFGEFLVSKDYPVELMEQIYVHNAIINTANRSVKTNTNCGCLPHPAYFTSKLPFWCQEDYDINVSNFLEVFSNPDFEFEDPREILIYNYLKNLSSAIQSVPSSDLWNLWENPSIYLERVNRSFLYANGDITQEQDCYLGSGSDLGCCGNYSGCCWLWTMWCLHHDLACLECDKWHCGPGCKSGV